MIVTAYDSAGYGVVSEDYPLGKLAQPAKENAGIIDPGIHRNTLFRF